MVNPYGAGCLHIDVNAANVMLSAAGHNADADRPAALIDFQHARFRDQPSVEWLTFEAAHFAKSCGRLGDECILNDWLGDLLKAIEPGDATDRDACRERFRHYLEADLSRGERKAIRP